MADLIGGTFSQLMFFAFFVLVEKIVAAKPIKSENEKKSH